MRAAPEEVLKVSYVRRDESRQALPITAHALQDRLEEGLQYGFRGGVVIRAGHHIMLFTIKREIVITQHIVFTEWIAVDQADLVARFSRKFFSLLKQRKASPKLSETIESSSPSRKRLE